MSDPRLNVGGGPPETQRDPAAVPPPLPPDDREAWYAPGVHAQDEVHPGVVVTVSETDEAFHYDVREPVLTAGDAASLERVEDYFADAYLERPRTREGAVERMEAGFDPKHERVLDSLLDCSPAASRRIAYHALASLAGLGELTAYALDDAIEVADAEDGLVVHTSDFAPARTDLPEDPPFLERFASERLERHTVEFLEFEMPVVLYRERLLGKDPFETKYAVREPDRLPGDDEAIEACKRHLWETPVEGVIEDEVEFVRERATALLSRRLSSRDTRAWAGALRHRVRSLLAEFDLAVPPVGRRFTDDRLRDLLYYVLRDSVGDGQLTVPIRDPMLEDIEANRVGERIKVIPRVGLGHNERIPSNLRFESEGAFVNVVSQLAAADGTELNASTPSAKVNLQPEGVDETIRCAVALPTVSEGGPHISIRKQSPDAMSPVDLVDRGSISTELVTLLWLVYEHHGVVLFSGPTGVGKTTLMNAHMPFIPFHDRPISIDEGSREVRLPHETGVSLTTRDHQSEHKRVTMADLMTECNYLNPDVEVIAEVNTAESFATFAETLNTGHGLIGTTHAGDVETLVNRVIEQGLQPYLLREIDLVVFPRKVDGERYVGEVVELLDDAAYESVEGAERTGVIEKNGARIPYNEVAWRTAEGAFEFAGATDGARSHRVFHSIAQLTDRSPDEVAAEFQRKHRYVEYMVQEKVDGFDETFELLADLRTNEAATVERLQSRRGVDEGAGRKDGVGEH
ncbi:MAG: type II/IV secretion system ATPase subunit [Haloarculaceae archaeon]